MCLDERCTDKRARPPVPALSSPRTRRWRRSNWFNLRSMAPASLLLAFLAVDVLALVAHALAGVGLGRARGTQLGGELADFLLVDARHGYQLLLGTGNLHLHPGGNLVDHVVAEPDLQLDAVLA